MPSNASIYIQVIELLLEALATQEDLTERVQQLEQWQTNVEAVWPQIVGEQ